MNNLKSINLKKNEFITNVLTKELKDVKSVWFRINEELGSFEPIVSISWDAKAPELAVMSAFKNAFASISQAEYTGERIKLRSLSRKLAPVYINILREADSDMRNLFKEDSNIFLGLQSMVELAIEGMSKGYFRSGTVEEIIGFISKTVPNKELGNRLLGYLNINGKI